MARARRTDREPLRLLSGEFDAGDSLLPAQLFRATAHFEGTRRLMAAVIEEGIASLAARGKPGREAEEWLLSADRSSPFSYLNLCDALDLDAEAVRRVALSWRDALGAARNGRAPAPSRDTIRRRIPRAVRARRAAPRGSGTQTASGR